MKQQQGLYNPAHEHDACGVGFVVNIKGVRSHAIVRQALQVLQHGELAFQEVFSRVEARENPVFLGDTVLAWHLQRLERDGGGVDRSIGRHDPARADDPARRHRVRAGDRRYRLDAAAGAAGRSDAWAASRSVSSAAETGRENR